VTRSRIIEIFGGYLPGGHNPNYPHFPFLEKKKPFAKPASDRDPKERPWLVFPLIAIKISLARFARLRTFGLLLLLIHSP
jgi:hypothetical protein